MRWIEYDPQFVRQRYNKLAPIFVLFEWLLLLPPGIRRKAVLRALAGSIEVDELMFGSYFIGLATKPSE
jgi:hypothetical protein